SDYRRAAKCDGPPLRSARPARGEQIDRRNRSKKYPTSDRTIANAAQSTRKVRLRCDAHRALGGRRTPRRPCLCPDHRHAIRSEAIIAALRNAMARPSDRHGQLEVSKLIDGIDPKSIRPVIERLQTLPNQREKSVYVAMLIARWAEGEPLAALAYAQTTGTP